MAVGVLGCMVTLAIYTGLVATYVGTTNTTALKTAVAFLFLIEVPYDFCLNGMQFVYLGEIWPTYLRAKGTSLGVAMISLMNIVWLQSAPIALA